MFLAVLCVTRLLYKTYLLLLTGAAKTNREKVIDSLNAEYGLLIKEDMSIDEAYKKIVKNRPRKLLSKHDYNNNGVPFRSARCVDEPKETDVRKIAFLLLPPQKKFCF